ncbi:MAG: hypothetical protein C4329_07190 [Chitinophagaceae bacterium]
MQAVISRWKNLKLSTVTSFIFATNSIEMKLKRTVLLSFGLLILSASLYRVWDGRPWGFAPQIAMAVFAGAVIKDKKWAFIVPLLSMFLSDALYQILYINHLSETQGFYGGQIINYILFTSLTAFGFLIKKINWLNVLAVSFAAPTAYFLISNFLVWIGGGGYHHAKTFNGLMLCYNDGLPFYRGSLEATALFSVIFFSTYVLMQRSTSTKQIA